MITSTRAADRVLSRMSLARVRSPAPRRPENGKEVVLHPRGRFFVVRLVQMRARNGTLVRYVQRAPARAKTHIRSAAG
jgi:hypothetical protein